MVEFLRRGLDKVYSKEIEAWKIYIDQKQFAVKLDKQMRAEVERFRKTLKSWQPEEMKEFVIENIDCLK